MNLNDGLLVVLLAFLAGMGNKFASEFIDYIKKKRKVLKEMILNNGKVNEK
jgi:hypothetical protein